MSHEKPHVCKNMQEPSIVKIQSNLHEISSNFQKFPLKNSTFHEVQAKIWAKFAKFEANFPRFPMEGSFSAGQSDLAAAAGPAALEPWVAESAAECGGALADAEEFVVKSA